MRRIHFPLLPPIFPPPSKWNYSKLTLIPSSPSCILPTPPPSLQLGTTLITTHTSLLNLPLLLPLLHVAHPNYTKPPCTFLSCDFRLPTDASSHTRFCPPACVVNCDNQPPICDKHTIVARANEYLGLYAGSFIATDEVIIEYTGDPITLSNYTKALTTNSSSLQYVIACGSKYLDAAKSGTKARFINHSCKPNAYFHPIYINSKPRIFVLSKFPIPLHVEITVDYGWEQQLIKGIPSPLTICSCSKPGLHYIQKPLASTTFSNNAAVATSPTTSTLPSIPSKTRPRISISTPTIKTNLTPRTSLLPTPPPTTTSPPTRQSNKRNTRALTVDSLDPLPEDLPSTHHSLLPFSPTHKKSKQTRITDFTISHTLPPPPLHDVDISHLLIPYKEGDLIRHLPPAFSHNPETDTTILHVPLPPPNILPASNPVSIYTDPATSSTRDRILQLTQVSLVITQHFHHTRFSPLSFVNRLSRARIHLHHFIAHQRSLCNYLVGLWRAANKFVRRSPELHSLWPSPQDSSTFLLCPLTLFQGYTTLFPTQSLSYYSRVSLFLQSPLSHPLNNQDTWLLRCMLTSPTLPTPFSAFHPSTPPSLLYLPTIPSITTLRLTAMGPMRLSADLLPTFSPLPTTSSSPGSSPPPLLGPMDLGDRPP